MLTIQKLLNFAATTLYFTTVISAASNRSQRPECPDDRMMVYVNVTESDREKYHINRTSASSLLECTQKCYNDPHCFSLKYREKDALSCLLTNFSPASCLEIISLPVAEIKYDIHTLITIECIKCELTKPKKLQTSKPDGNDKPSLLSEEPLNDISISPLSTLQNTIAFVSNTSICDSSPLKCHENIWFITEEQSDSESFDFLNETVIVNSIQECAKKCFDNCCKMAIYSSVEKKCQFTKESTSSIDSDSCKTKPFSSYVDQNEYNRTKIICVICDSSLRSNRYILRTHAGNSLNTEKSIRLDEKRGSEKTETEILSESTEASPSSSSEQPTITSTFDTLELSQSKEGVFQLSRLDSRFMEMACIVVFEVDPKANVTQFQAQDSVKVDRAEHCAYLCFRDACAAAIFTPATASGTKGTCERRFDIAENCNATLRRHYYYKTDKPIYLQCFRCLPEKLQMKPSLEAVTPQSGISLRLSSEAESVTKTETSAALMETTLIPAVELTTVEMDSKEIEKNIGTIAFDTTKGDIEASASVDEGKVKVTQEEDTNLVGTAQTFETYFGIESRSNEQTQVTTESTEVFTSGAQTETSATAILISATDMEVTTNGATIWSSISDKAFESDSSIAETESGAYIFGSISSNIPTTIINTQSTQKYESTASRMQAFEFAHQSTTEGQESTSADTEKLDVWRQLTTETGASHDTLPYGSQRKMESDGAEFTGTDITVNEIGEAITLPITVPAAVEKSERRVEQFSTKAIMSSSTGAGTAKFTEAKSNERMEIAGIADEIRQETPDIHSEVIYPDGNTETTSSYFKRENEVVTSSNSSAVSSITLDKSTLTSSKEKKNASLSNNVSESFHTYLQGCIVTFQADPHSKRPTESSAGFQSSTTAQTAEVCAGQCYKDGCTGAKYNPSSKECVLSYSGKHFCNNGPEHFFYKTNETVWIHCTGCKLHKPGDEGIDIMIQSSKAKTNNTTTLPSTEAVEAEAQKVKSTKPSKTLRVKSGVASETLSFSTSEIEKSMEHAAERVITEIPISLPPSSLATVEETSTETAKVSTAGEGGLELTIRSTVERKEKVEDLGANIIPSSSNAGKTEESVSKEEITAAPFQTTLFGNDCTVLFQARPIDVHSKKLNFEFIAISAIPTVEQCAKRCYMDGCIGAKFDPANQKCLLAFGDHHQCDENEQVHHSLKATEILWIHCISCKKEFTESTLGLFVQDTTTLPAMIEKSKGVQDIGLEFSAKRKESTVAGEAFGTASTTVVVEEQETTRPSTLQSSMEPLGEQSDLSVGMELISTIAGVIEKFAETSLQTPLTVSADAKISGSSTASPTVKEPTITSRTEISEGKDQEEAIVEFQEEGEPSTISAEITITPMSRSKNAQKFNKITDDIVEVVASVIANISNSVPENVTDTVDIKQTSSIPEKSTTETNEVMSSVAPQTIGSHVTKTLANVKGTSKTDTTSSVTEETTSAKLDTEVTQLKHASIEKVGNDVGSSNIPNATSIELVSTVTFIAKETSTSTSNQKNIEVTSGILHKTSEEGHNPDEALFAQSQSVSNSITEQPFVQENVDDIIEKVVQSTLEKDILINDTKPAVADETIQVVTEMTEGSLNVADTLVKGGEYMTTELPVQAVSDLISVLSQNSKIEEVLRKEEESDAFIVDGVSVTEDADVQMTTDIVINHLQEDSTKNFLLNSVKTSLFKGIIAGCPGRIEFEILEIKDLSQLNVTSEILVESPAACAMKCYERANCVLAAYKPSQNDESTAVCLLTNNSGICSPEGKSIPQHKSDVSPLIISCLKCTECNYTVSTTTELTRIHQPEIVEPALYIGQCAKICWKHNCTVSQYDHRSNLCSLSLVKVQEDCPQETPIVVNGDEAVLLECVRCFPYSH